jgi:hypothetical protein
MLSPENPFESASGSNRLMKPVYLALILCITVISALVISRMEVIGGLILIILPFVFAYVYYLFLYPILGLYTAIGFGFLLLGLARYVSGIQMGIVLDVLLIITFIALFFNRFKDRIDFTPAKKDVTFLALIWSCYFVFEFVNPEVVSREVWFAGRGVALYMLMIVPLTLLFINSNKKLDIFFLLWGIFSLLATAKGLMQHFWHVDYAEQQWLNEGNASTHILFGKLRVFSFMSDAGQFGANQGYSAVVAIIIAFVQKKRKMKIFFIVVALMGFYGMVISGTRGAISVPFAGLAAFFVLRKNTVALVSGFILIAAFFIFFKYTFIGQGNAEIRRMRSAFDPNNASLQVRLDNQKKLKEYLATRPFGGGIGHAGGKARKFAPKAFLSNVPADSWYVLIWAEQGIVGLTLHLLILFYIVIKGSFNVMFRIRDPIVKTKMAALVAGMFGIMAASYGNMVLGQMPTSVLIYMSMAIMLSSEVFDADALAEQQKLQVAVRKTKTLSALQ